MDAQKGLLNDPFSAVPWQQNITVLAFHQHRHTLCRPPTTKISIAHQMIEEALVC